MKPKTSKPRRSPNREFVLAILQRSETPLTAYKILAEMRERNPKAAAPTVYRALDALVKSGCVHRVESINAFVACQRERHDCPAVMSICDECGLVEERSAPRLVGELSNMVAASGFAPQRHVIEVHGRCASCDSEKRNP